MQDRPGHPHNSCWKQLERFTPPSNNSILSIDPLNFLPFWVMRLPTILSPKIQNKVNHSLSDNTCPGNRRHPRSAYPSTLVPLPDGRSTTIFVGYMLLPKLIMTPRQGMVFHLKRPTAYLLYEPYRAEQALMHLMTFVGPISPSLHHNTFSVRTFSY